ncbi:MAG: hypothetical protein AAGB05_18175 [Pseudomonadota bacterium]
MSNLFWLTDAPMGRLASFVDGGVRSGHVAAQDRARGWVPSAMARALPKELARALALRPAGPILRGVIR